MRELQHLAICESRDALQAGKHLAVREQFQSPKPYSGQEDRYRLVREYLRLCEGQESGHLRRPSLSRADSSGGIGSLYLRINAERSILRLRRVIKHFLGKVRTVFPRVEPTDK